MSIRYAGTSKENLALDTFVKLFRAARATKERIDGQNTNGDLSESQFGTLEMLFHLGPLHQKRIGEKLLISKSNVVGVIDALEKRGLVQRQRSLEDRRCIFVHITENGRCLIQELLPGHVAAIVEALDVLTASEQTELGHLCRKLGLGEKL